MDKKHLIIVLFSLVFTSIVAVAFLGRVNYLALFNTDSGNAQNACFVQTFTISAQPAGHTFSKQCVQDGGQIYDGDSRFTFFDMGGGQLPRGFSYVKTDNVSAKNDPNLNWSITLQADSTVYVYYRRKIAVTRPPTWLDTNFTSNTAQTSIDIRALNHYVLRKNNSNPKIGVYDAYFAQRGAGSVVNFGPASQGNGPALSMYLVAVLPDIAGNPTSNPSATPITTCAPGIDCGNDGSPTAIPTATPTAQPTASVTPSRTPSPQPSGDNSSPGTTPAPGARETSVYLQTQNGSGQSGYAVITEMSANQTRVSLSLFGGSYTDQPAHIHSGTCASPGAVIYPLNNVNGTSITYLNAPYTTVVNSIGIVNIHKSVAESNVYTACGTK